MNKILFSAEWCAPCFQLKEFAEKNDIKFDEKYDVDTDEGRDAAAKYGVRGVPTTIVMENGVETDRVVGFDVAKITSLKGA